MFIFFKSPIEAFRYLLPEEVEILTGKDKIQEICDASEKEALEPAKQEADIVAAEKKNDWSCSFCLESDTSCYYLDSQKKLEPAKQEADKKRYLVTHCRDFKQHSFHYECIIDWLKEHNRCFVCQKEVSWNKICTWKERITHSSFVKNADLIQKVLRQGLNNIIIRRLYIGGTLVSAGLLTNNDCLTMLGLFIPSTGFYLIKNKSLQQVEILSTELNEANRTIKQMEQIRENSKRRIEELVSKKEATNKQIFPKEFKRLKKQIGEQDSLFNTSSSNFSYFSNRAQIVTQDLRKTRIIYVATAAAQYAFFMLSMVSLYYAFRREISS